MNFLSHYYFDRNTSPYEVLGSVLPDLIKNADKHIHLYPQRNETAFNGSTEEMQILKGWKRHLEVDLAFHSSGFFMENTRALKILIQPLTEGTAVRPSFLAHIGLELLLDHLLIEKNILYPDDFYKELDSTAPEVIVQFLKNAGLEDPFTVVEFIARFKSSRYLLSYQKLENISYALNRICMRIWPETMKASAMQALTIQLGLFKDGLQHNFKTIFDQLQSRLD